MARSSVSPSRSSEQVFLDSAETATRPSLSTGSLANVLSKGLLLLRGQTLADVALYRTVVTLVRCHGVLFDPSCNIEDLREVVPDERLACVKCGEGHAESNIINVRLGDDFVTTARRYGRWIGKKVEQHATCVGPSLLELLSECLRVAHGLRERDHGKLPVDWTCELLRLGQYEGRVDLAEDLLVDLIGLLDEIVRAVASLQPS